MEQFNVKTAAAQIADAAKNTEQGPAKVSLSYKCALLHLFLPIIWVAMAQKHSSSQLMTQVEHVEHDW